MTRKSSSVPAHREPAEMKTGQIKKVTAIVTAVHTCLPKLIRIPNSE